MSESPQRKQRKKTTATFENPNLDIYIYRVLKQIHPDTGLTGEATAEINNLNKYIMSQVMNSVNDLLKRHNKKTLDARDIETGVKLALKGQLAKHAISEGTKAVEKFNKNFSQKKKGEKPISRKELAGLQFPIARTATIMRHLSIVERMSQTSPVFMAAVLEYLTAELLELSGNETRDNKKVRITPRHLSISIMRDEELCQLFENVILGGGVLPHVPPQKSSPKKKTSRKTKKPTDKSSTKPSTKKVSEKKSPKKSSEKKASEKKASEKKASEKKATATKSRTKTTQRKK